MQGTYLVHHGIKGQRWGIRRYQNEDGTLTEAGRKRYGYASKEAAERAKEYRNYADEYRDELGISYFEGKGAEDRWLQSMYGDDYKNKEYMKKYFNVDDVYEHARQGIAEDRKRLHDEDTSMIKYYESLAKEWEAKSKKYANTKLSDLDPKSLREAKKLTHDYLNTPVFVDDTFGNTWKMYNRESADKLESEGKVTIRGKSSLR